MMTAARAAPTVDKGRGVMMLHSVRKRVSEEYYDPALNGFPLEQRCAEAEKRLEKAETNAQMFRIIGQVFMDLGDSHTIFIPPLRTVTVSYGWVPMIVGNDCYVRWVDEGSDAQAKGVKPGDRIESIQGISANRDTLWRLQYLFRQLDPQGGLHVAIQSPGGEMRQVDLMAKVTQDRKVLDLANSGGADLARLLLRGEAAMERRASAFAEVGDTLVWRLPSFDRPSSDLDDGLAKMRGAKSVILDLRGNSGGFEATLERLLDHCFDHEVVAGFSRRREGGKRLVVRPEGTPFKGLLLVLIDAESASAAEIFARVMQLEDRGIVLGDRSKGAVQRAKVFADTVDVNPVVPFWVEVTVGTFVARDRKPLEGVGVAPDLPVRPTGADMAAGRDPVLALALAQTGHKVSAEEAGKLLPPDHRDEDAARKLQARRR